MEPKNQLEHLLQTIQNIIWSFQINQRRKREFYVESEMSKSAISLKRLLNQKYIQIFQSITNS